MSRIAPQSHEPVLATPRKTMTREHRERILDRQDGHCGGCMKDVGWFALPFEVDHIIPIWFNGADADFNLVALCKPCHKIKTATDIKAIAKAKRRMAKFAETSPFKPSRLRSRGFDKTKTRSFTGQVRERS